MIKIVIHMGMPVGTLKCMYDKDILYGILLFYLLVAIV